MDLDTPRAQAFSNRYGQRQVPPKPMTEEALQFFQPKIPVRQLEYRLLSDEERTKPLDVAEKQVFFDAFKKTKVVITAVKDLNDFYVVREDNQEAIETMNDSLTTAATFGLTAYHPMREQTRIACARNDNNQWSRVEVLRIDVPDNNNNKYNVYVRYIDTGKEGILSPTSIQTVPDWVLAKPQYAYHCSLIIRPVNYTFDGKCQAEENAWAPSMIESLRKLGKYYTAPEQTAHLGLELTCFRKEIDRCIVDLKLAQRPTSWTESLVEYGAARWMEGLGLDDNEEMDKDNTE